MDEPALWAVRANLVQWKTANAGPGGAWFSRAARNLFVDRQATPIPPDAPTILPGTIAVRCRILSTRLTILGTRYDFRAEKRALEAELLIQAAPDDWVQVGRDLRLRQAVCVGGQFPLASLTPSG